MYNFVFRIQDGLGELKKLLEIYIYNQGFVVIEKCGEVVLNDFKMYVQIVFDVYKKYNVLVMFVFNNDVGFVVVFDKVCGCFINNNVVIKMVQLFSKFFELLV